MLSSVSLASFRGCSWYHFMDGIALTANTKHKTTATDFILLVVCGAKAKISVTRKSFMIYRTDVRVHVVLPEQTSHLLWNP